MLALTPPDIRLEGALHVSLPKAPVVAGGPERAVLQRTIPAAAIGNLWCGQRAPGDALCAMPSAMATRHRHARPVRSNALEPRPGSVSRQLTRPSTSADAISAPAALCAPNHIGAAVGEPQQARHAPASRLWTWPCHTISPGPILANVPNRTAFPAAFKDSSDGSGLEYQRWARARRAGRRRASDTGFLGVFGRRRRLAGLERASQDAQLWRERRRDGSPLPWCRVDSLCLVANSARCPGHRGNAPFHNCGGCCGKPVTS